MFIYACFFKKKQLCLLGALLLFQSITIAAESSIHRDINDRISQFLQDYTSPRGVYYSELKNQKQLDQIISDMAVLAPGQGPSEELAYWLNCYNLLTIKLVADHYPIDSIIDLHLFGSLVFGHIMKQTVWHRYYFGIRNQSLNLDQIEHQIIRPRFKDYRIHAALVCAAKSCPPLRREAYQGHILDKQLDEQMHNWLGDTSRNYYNSDKNILYLSSVFKWFESDFTHGKQPLLDVVLKWMPANVQQKIHNREQRPQIKFLDYDWALNVDYRP